MAKIASAPLSKITAKIAALQLKSEKLTAEIKALNAVVAVESKKITVAEKAAVKPAAKAAVKKPAAAKKAAAAPKAAVKIAPKAVK